MWQFVQKNRWRRVALLACMVVGLLAGNTGGSGLLAQESPPRLRNAPAADFHAGSLLARAKNLIRQGRTADAEKTLRQCLAADGNNETAHVLLGLVLYQEKKPAKSLGQFTAAARIKTPGASELIIVGLDYVLLREIAKADRWMAQATEVDPANASAWRYLGGIRYSENHFEVAIDAYRRDLKLRPDDVLAEDAIGRCYEGLGREKDAENAYRTAISWQAAAVHPYARPFLHLGVLLQRQGETRKAVALLKRAEALAPDDADIHEHLGEAWKQAGQMDKAQAEVEKALALAPGNWHLHWVLASILRREGKKDEADRQDRIYSAMLGSHSGDNLH